MGDFAAASSTFCRIKKTGKPDSLIFQSRYEAALCSYLAGDLSFAEGELGRMRSELKDTLLFSDALYLEVIIFTEQEKWLFAQKQYLLFCRSRGIDPTLSPLIASEKELHLKSEKKAQVLSLLLPGLGQAYAGKPWRGLSSLLLTGGAITYGVYSVSQHLWITGIFTGLTFTLRFYSGGNRYALRTVREYNKLQKNNYKKKVRDMVINAERNYQSSVKTK